MIHPHTVPIVRTAPDISDDSSEGFSGTAGVPAVGTQNAANRAPAR